ncbi:MAG: hypothetical protein ABMB14_15275 [Myxococcota bacterium]
MVTWRVTDLAQNTVRALRVLTDAARPHAAALELAASRQRSVVHPNRLHPLATVTIDGAPAVLTEFVTGPTLATWLRVRKRSPDDVLAVFRDVVLGVAAGNHTGEVHRVIEPTAVWMQSRRGRFVPKVDLAIGPVYAGMGLGPPGDARVDVYALGALLFEMFAARPIDPPPTGLTARLTSWTPGLAAARPDLPPEVVALVDALTAVEPTRRPADADAVLSWLDRGTPPPQLEARPVGVAARSLGSVVGWLRSLR